MKIFILSLSAFALYFNFNSPLFSGENVALKNYEGSHTCEAREIMHPSSIEQVQGIVKKARSEAKKVMTGSERFNSQIDAACADMGQVQLTLKNLNKLVKIDKENMTVAAEAGMRFNDLNEALDKERLAINMVTELNIFTLGGMLGSGTHGTTLKNKSALIADYVSELKVVDGRGDLRVLSGEDLDKARVNLGVLGVVVEMTIEVEPAFKVRALQLNPPNDSDLESKILELAENNFSASVSWFPGLKSYTATLYNKVDYDTPGDAYNAQADAPLWKFKLFKDISYYAHKTINASCNTALFRYITRHSSFFKSKSDGEYIKGEVVGKSHDVQYFQCKKKDGKNICPWDVFKIKLQEIGISYEDTIPAIKDIREVLAKKRSCFSLNGIYFRFTNASNSILSMNAGRKTTFIGIEYTLNPSGGAPFNYDVFQELEQLLLKKYNGRPHFGKNSVPVFLDVKDKFPRFNEFVEFKKQMDPDNVFTNEFWERISAEKLSSDILNKINSKGCVENDTCYCSEDPALWVRHSLHGR